MKFLNFDVEIVVVPIAVVVAAAEVVVVVVVVVVARLKQLEETPLHNFDCSRRQKVTICYVVVVVDAAAVVVGHG